MGRYMRGFAQLYLILVLVVVSVVGGAVYYRQNLATKVEQTQSSGPEESASPSAATSPTSKPTATIAKTNTPIPSKITPTATRTPTPTSSSTSSAKKNTCGINVINGKLGGGSSDPLLVTLVYSFSGFNNSYMAGAQWDFDGNGSWDTNMSQPNGTIEHTYGLGGSKNVRLQVKASDGSTTDICSKTFSLADALEVSLKGTMFDDINCNGTRDSGEIGVSNIKMTAMSPGGNVYADVFTDSSGNYSFTRKIKADESLDVMMGSADHNALFDNFTVTLNKNNPTYTKNIVHYPVGSCGY